MRVFLVFGFWFDLCSSSPEDICFHCFQREWKGERERKKMDVRETHLLAASLTLPTSGQEVKPQPRYVHVTTNQTRNPLVHRPTLKPQATPARAIRSFNYFLKVHKCLWTIYMISFFTFVMSFHFICLPTVSFCLVFGHQKLQLYGCWEKILFSLYSFLST